MPGAKPITFAINGPVEEALPKSNLASVINGATSEFVVQQTPYEVGLGTPKLSILQFAVAVVDPTLATGTLIVVTIGSTSSTFKFTVRSGLISVKLGNAGFVIAL